MRAPEREFDAKAVEYESNRLSGWYKAQGRLVMDELLRRDTAPAAVLDIGCGTGWFLRRLMQELPRAHGYGIDLSSRMVARARELAAEEGIGNVNFVHGDWEDPQASKLRRLAGRPMDVVSCISTVHYFQHPAAAVQSMARMLSPGGALVIVERARQGSILTRLWDQVHRRFIRDGVRFHDEAEVVEWLERAGLQNAHVAAELRKLFWQGKLYTSLAMITADKAPVSD